ncbi:hypothetical protein Ga0074812_11941 [Parafrankia irregularis]|uniref:Lipopolysaccharide assembly protein A domain-containing protein n=1 Tax=Parafrankia irregularis TaxID=795642 RepID=A0A0S4QU91_9ACTN|nr:MULTISPECIES: hypothetical protein [Parafrankia]MBE3204558.1 hypothetical protein [Parafrankia sp. CH37]CUU58408.1 hypothetical protein Ga0074812_11941 [Parafrankia irregularis]
MVTVGVVLVLLAGVLTADIVLESSGQTELMIMGQALSFDVWGLFVLGVATGVLAVAGIQLGLQGFARDRQRLRAQRQQARDLAAMTRPVPGAHPSPSQPRAAATAAATGFAPRGSVPGGSVRGGAVTTAGGSAPAPAPAAPAPAAAPSSQALAPSSQRPSSQHQSGQGQSGQAPIGRPAGTATAPTTPLVVRGHGAGGRGSTARAGDARTTGAGSRSAPPADAPVPAGRAAASVERPSTPSVRHGRPSVVPRTDRVVARVADLRRRNSDGAQGPTGNGTPHAQDAPVGKSQHPGDPDAPTGARPS